MLLIIFSLLQSGDTLSVRSTCRRLRDIGSDSSLWHAIALSYYGPCDDPCLKLALKLSVPNLRKFSLMVVASSFCAISVFPLLKRSPNVTSVSLHGCKITQAQLNTITTALPRLVDLKVCLSFVDVITALQCTCRLQSLVVTLNKYILYIDIERIVSVWCSIAGYNPPELGIR